MTREERENALHCLGVMIDEEVCEECNLYGTTGTDHCQADCVRAAIEALKQEPKTKNDLGVDAVSRQAVIDLMMQKWGEKFSGDDAMQESIDAIRDMPSVTPQEPRWIPVSERLPDIHNYSEHYFVTLKRGGVYIAMFTECDGKHWWTYDDVIAWMPLPKLYKAESEE